MIFLNGPDIPLATAITEALADARAAATPEERISIAYEITTALKQGDLAVGEIRRAAIAELKASGLSLSQIADLLGVAKGTVQVHIGRHVHEGLIFAIRDTEDTWHPASPSKILPDGVATGDSIYIPKNKPSLFAGQWLVCAYEDHPTGRLPDNAPQGVYLTKYGRVRRATREVHEVLWGSAKED